MGLNPQEGLLESKCERIARIITGKYQIKVRIFGTNAYYDFESQELVLPNLADEEFAVLGDVIDGFLDHESAHPMFTDPKYVPDENANSTLFELWNVAEDSWIEREMGTRYVGCKQNLEKLNNKIAGHVIATWKDLNELEKLLFVLGECWRGKTTSESFHDDSSVGELVKSLEPEIKAGSSLASTKDAVDLARKILAKIQKQGNQQKNKKSKSEKQSQQQQGGKDQEQQEQQEQQGKQEQQEQQEQQGKQGKQEQQGKQGKQGKQEQQGKQGKQEQQAQQQAQRVQQQVKEDDCAPLNAERFLNRILDEQLSIRDTSRHSDPEHYLVFSTEYDTEKFYDSDQRFHWSKLYAELKSEIQSYVGNLSSMLSLALTEETQSRWVGGARKGRKFDKRKLSQWFCGSDDDRIFAQLEQGLHWDTAISLLFDCSGSMGSNRNRENKAALARLSAIAFHEALLSSDVVHEILGFNSGGRVPSEFHDLVDAARKKNSENLRRYSRLDDTDNRMVFVPFGAKDGRALCAIDGGAANRDGECVLWAAKRLAARTEKRKVLIVASDGLPAGARYRYTEKKYLQEVVQRVIGAGIELYAIGIKSEHVKGYYPNWITIDSASDLPKVVLQLCQTILKRKGTEHGNLPTVIRPTSGASS